MQNIAVEQQRGHVLLIAGDAAVRRRTVQVAPSANLAALGVVPVAMLLASEVPSDTTYLDGARDPNTVLMRLRTAAATPGPLLVYLSGQAHRRPPQPPPAPVPRRDHPGQRPLHGAALGVAGHRAARPSRRADHGAPRPRRGQGRLAAAPGVRQPARLALRRGLRGGRAARLRGQPARVSGYTREWINQLRSSPGRPANLQLHAFAVGSAALPPGALVLPTTRELEAAGGREAVREPVREPAGASGPVPPAAVPQAAQGPVPPPRPGHAPGASPGHIPGQDPGQDPRPHIHALATAGRHLEAATLAQAWEQHVLQAYGYTSAEATQWAEIRADLARMAGNFRLATQLWTSAGRARLAHQPPDAPEVKGAAAGALYCWTQLKDQAAAVEAGPELISLLRALPSLDPRHLELARQRLELLSRTPIGR